MSNNIIDFKNIRDHIFFNNLNKKEIGNINITVYSTDICNSPIYYILPDKKELLPIVDLIDELLLIILLSFLKEKILKTLNNLF